MSTDSPGIWRQAAELFDELAPLKPSGRRALLANRDVSPRVQQWLEELLAAHDGDRTTIIDREIDRLVEGLVPEARAAGDSEEHLIGRDFGPWRATRKLGHGGMGLVLAGERWDGQFKMNVAIKLLDPSAFGPSLNEQFRREVRFLAELSHPGIAQLLDGGVTDDGLPYLVMEYIDGRPVDRFCREEQLDFDARLGMFRSIAEAVDHCHRHLVVHCDIKPANVLVDRDGQVRLLDFGIASRLVSDKAAGSDRSRVRWCSPGFAAPECLEGAPPTVSEDIFALGALLYLLLTGAGIRSAPEMTRLLQGQPVKEVPPRPSERAAARGVSRRTVKRIRGDLDAIVMGSLATLPEARYRSVRALLDDLDRWGQGMPVSAHPPSRRYRLACWLKRHRVAAGAGLTIFAALLGGTGIAVWQADQAREQARLAEQSLAETEQALQRVTGLRDFIVDLFDTVEPDRPRDELPSTREILRAGRERVLGDTDLAAGERFELLYTLGRIHESLFLREAATELLESAVALARRHEALQGEDLALALRRLAWAVGGQGNLNRAAELFDEALAQARSAGIEKLEVQVAADRAYLMLAIGEVDAGLQRLEGLERRLVAAEQPDPNLEYAVMGPLGTAYSMKGELESSIAAHQKAVRAAKAAYGPDGNRYAMTLANLANARASLGQLPAAKTELERAVDAYDRIYADGPSETRAAAITNLARVDARLGRFDRALEQMRVGSAEWARSMNKVPRQRPQFHQDLAWVLARARRWQPALEHLRRAEELLREQSSTASDELARSLFMQGMILCRQGHAKRGGEKLDSAAALLAGEGFQPFHLEAERLEAIAACRLAREEWGGAMEAIERARERTQPGWVLQHVELFLMAARARHALAGGPAAEAELESARAYLGELSISAGHPAFVWIDQHASSG